MNKYWLCGIAFAAALAVNCRSEVRSQVILADELRITVYDQAHLPWEVLHNAIDRLNLILQQAKIPSQSILGDLAEPEASLFMYVSPPPNGEEARMACAARRDIALKIIDSSPKSLSGEVLGMSSPFAAFGLNVRIFSDHIHEAAARHGLSPAMVLAYAMAHEIGHVLLRNSSHGQSGIMAAVWTNHVYRQMAHDGLVFSGAESSSMSATLRAPVCHGSAPSPYVGDQ